jgi:putative tricarboxylic transport membrane protein
MSDRIFAVVWLAVVAGLAYLATRFEVTFTYEPMGPKAYPLMLAGLMALCALYLIVKPDAEASWLRGALLKRTGVMVAALFLYAFLFEWLGFIAATALLVTALGRLFGGTWTQCAAGGLVMGVALFFAFDKLLDVTLPLGSLITSLQAR